MEKLAMEYFKDKMEDLLPLKLNYHLEQCFLENGIIECEEVGDDFLSKRIAIVDRAYFELTEQYNFGQGKNDFEISHFTVELNVEPRFLQHSDLVKKNIILNLRSFFGSYVFQVKDENINFILKKK